MYSKPQVDDFFQLMTHVFAQATDGCCTDLMRLEL